MYNVHVKRSTCFILEVRRMAEAINEDKHGPSANTLRHKEPSRQGHGRRPLGREAQAVKVESARTSS